MISTLLFNSKFFNKFLNYFFKKGKKEKIENKVLSSFTVIDFYLFLEGLHAASIPFKMYSKKKHSGRHSFSYYNVFFFIALEEQYLKAAFYLFLIIKALAQKKNTNFNVIAFNQFFKTSIITEKKFSIYAQHLKKKREIMFLKSYHHYRWTKK